jgi:hypothetical protein
MQIDKTQRRWGLASLGILVAALVIYLLNAWSAPQGPRGGSAIGLFFGVVGFGFMIFAALLGARKRVPTWRLGRAKAWMKGHLWLGLLALPMILFHGGFNFGGTLTRMLMWLLIITVTSGLYGAALQNSIPKKMTADIPLETIYDEISHVRTLLREEADRAVEGLCGDLGLKKVAGSEVQRAGGVKRKAPHCEDFICTRCGRFWSSPNFTGDDWRMPGGRRVCLLACRRCCRRRPMELCRTCQIYVTRRDSSCGRRVCIAGCMVGCCCIYRFRWR